MHMPRKRQGQRATASWRVSAPARIAARNAAMKDPARNEGKAALNPAAEPDSGKVALTGVALISRALAPSPESKAPAAMESATTIDKRVARETERERQAKHAAASTEYATRAVALIAAADGLPDGQRGLRAALAAVRAALALVTRRFDAFCLQGVLAVYETESKATVENREKTSYNPPDMGQSPDIGGATLELRQSLFVQLAREIGVAAAGNLLVGAASPDDRARLVEGMAARGRELTRRAPPPKLSEAELAAIVWRQTFTTPDKLLNKAWAAHSRAPESVPCPTLYCSLRRCRCRNPPRKTFARRAGRLARRCDGPERPSPRVGGRGPARHGGGLGGAGLQPRILARGQSMGDVHFLPACLAGRR